MRSRPVRSLRTSPAFESVFRCFVIAWREIVEPSVSRTIDKGPSLQSRATMTRRVSSLSAANIAAASVVFGGVMRDRDVMKRLLTHSAARVRYFSMSCV